MSKPITYHKSHKFVKNDGTENTFITQLYQICVYGILNNNPKYQGNFTPQNIVKMEKDLKKALDKGEIKSFELGTPITVQQIDGFWKECNEKN